MTISGCAYLSPERKAARLLDDGGRIHQQVRRRALFLAEHVQLAEALRLEHLVLPRYRHRAGVELRVKVLVGRVQIHPLYRRELLDVEHVFGIHGVGLKGYGRQSYWALNASRECFGYSRRERTVALSDRPRAASS